MPLTQSLATRRTVRAFSPTPLTKAELSQILWAAQGITGAEERRTAPSAGNQHYVRVYVASAEGFFQYLANGHQLQMISGEDLRSKLSSQPAFSQAPAVLLLAGDYERAAVRYPGEKAPRFIAIEAGHIRKTCCCRSPPWDWPLCQLAGSSRRMFRKRLRCRHNRYLFT